MPGTKWVTADVITFARMNQKTLIVQAAEPAIMYPGMMWLDIDDDMLYQRKAANNGWYNVLKEELAYTITGLHTYDRDPAAPFAVSAGSAKVTNLDADQVDGVDIPATIAEVLTDHDKAAHDALNIDADTVDGVEEAAFLLVAGTRNRLIPDPVGDHSASGDTVLATAGEAVAIGDICYLKLTTGKFWKADANAEATAKGMLALATAVIAAEASGVFLVFGKYRDDTWGWTVGQELYIHTTPGNPTGTKPSGSGDIIRCIGHASAATILFFNPDQIYVEHI